MSVVVSPCISSFQMPENGLPALIQKMSFTLGFLKRYLPSRSVRVKLKIPKFKMDSEFEASEVLKGLGVVAHFHRGLTEMVDSQSHWVSLCLLIACYIKLRHTHSHEKWW